MIGTLASAITGLMGTNGGFLNSVGSLFGNHSEDRFGQAKQMAERAGVNLPDWLINQAIKGDGWQARITTYINRMKYIKAFEAENQTIIPSDVVDRILTHPLGNAGWQNLLLPYQTKENNFSSFSSGSSPLPLVAIGLIIYKMFN